MSCLAVSSQEASPFLATPFDPRQTHTHAHALLPSEKSDYDASRHHPSAVSKQEAPSLNAAPLVPQQSSSNSAGVEVFPIFLEQRKDIALKFHAQFGARKTGLLDLVGPWCIECFSYVCCHKPLPIVHDNIISWIYEDSIIANSIQEKKSCVEVKNVDVKACFLNVCFMFSSGAHDLDNPMKNIDSVHNRTNKHNYFHHQLFENEYDIPIFAETRTNSRARIYSEFVIFSSACSDCCSCIRNRYLVSKSFLFETWWYKSAHSR